jgi:hypothetical protein
LDSALKRLVVADTSIPVTPVVVDTNLYVPIAQLTGDGLPVAGKERGVFLRYDAGKLVFRITSDGDVQGESYDRVFNARIAVKNVSLTGLGTASLDDAAVGSKFDSDSVSSLVVTSAIGGGLSAAQANMFSRFRLKTFSVVASQCTVEVDISLRSGVIPLGTPAWVMPAIPDEATKGLLFLGNGRTHPSRTHFRIVIP